jgi:hypothetical protein
MTTTIPSLTIADFPHPSQGNDRGKHPHRFQPQAVPITYRADRAIADDHLPNLHLTPQELFERAGLT